MVDTGINYKTPRIDQPISELKLSISKNNDINIDKNSVSRSWWNYFNTRSGMNISSGDGAPTNVPNQIGDEYLDLTNKKLYKSFGVTDVTDWILIN